MKLYISIKSFRFKEHVITSQLGAPPTLNHQRSRRAAGAHPTPILESSVSAYLKSRKISVTVVAPIRSYWSYGQIRGAVQGYRRHHPLGLFATWVVPVGHLAWPLQSVAGPGAQHLRWPVGHGGPFETFCNDRSYLMLLMGFFPQDQPFGMDKTIIKHLQNHDKTNVTCHFMVFF